MKPVTYVRKSTSPYYDKDTFFSRIKDRAGIKYEGEKYISDLNLKIFRAAVPPNINQNAYYKNIIRAKNMVHAKDSYLAPNVFRKMDFYLLSDFQKKLFAYSVVNSIQLIFRIHNKSIENKPVLVYDAADNLCNMVIAELSKVAKYIILLSEDLRTLKNKKEYIISRYGVSPIITSDKVYAFETAEFVIISKDIDISLNIPVWFLDNCKSVLSEGVKINDVTFLTPWNVENLIMSPELVGAIIQQMGDKDVETALRKNKIILDEMKLNELSAIV